MSNKKDYTITTVSSSGQQHGIAQAPFSLSPNSNRLRNTGAPYIAGPTTALDMGLINSIPPDHTPLLPLIEATSIVYSPSVDQTVPLSLIAGTSIIYSPTVTGVGDLSTYTEIVSASNPDNSTPMHVGSMYLDARTYTTIGAMITDIKGGVGGSDAHIELKRFTNGSTLMSASNTSTAGPTWEYVTQSSVVVSTADWYDIYISASGNPATSSIRGIYYEY